MQQNFLSPTGFKFVINRLPNVAFYVQAATLPGLSTGSTQIGTPFKNLKFAGDKLEYEPFTITIRLDEYMEAHAEMVAWLEGLTKPFSYDQHAALKASEHGLYSDATLTILNSKGNPALDISLRDIFPVAVSSVRFDTTETDINYVTCDITFEHNGFTMIRH